MRHYKSFIITNYESKPTTMSSHVVIKIDNKIIYQLYGS